MAVGSCCCCLFVGLWRLLLTAIVMSLAAAWSYVHASLLFVWVGVVGGHCWCRRWSLPLLVLHPKLCKCSYKMSGSPPNPTTHPTHPTAPSPFEAALIARDREESASKLAGAVSTETTTSSASSGAYSGKDPFLVEEDDPTACNAADSSLWELEVRYYRQKGECVWYNSQEQRIANHISFT